MRRLQRQAFVGSIAPIILSTIQFHTALGSHQHIYIIQFSSCAPHTTKILTFWMINTSDGIDKHLIVFLRRLKDQLAYGSHFSDKRLSSPKHAWSLQLHLLNLRKTRLRFFSRPYDGLVLATFVPKLSIFLNGQPKYLVSTSLLASRYRATTECIFQHFMAWPLTLRASRTLDDKKDFQVGL